MPATNTTATRTAHAASESIRKDIKKGDVVLVLAGYNMDTKARTNIDAWTDTHMVVIKVCGGDDCLLDYDADGEGEVYINGSRLVSYE